MAQKRRRAVRQVCAPGAEHRHPVGRTAILPVQRIEQVAVCAVAGQPYGNDSVLMIEFNVQKTHLLIKSVEIILDGEWKSMLFAG